jgi:hypothetical protein
VNTQEITVTRGDSFTIGNVQFYTNRNFPTATLVTVNGETFLEIGATLYTPCLYCEYGTKTQHMGVYAGVCFQCNGRGFDRKVGTVEDAARIARRRVTDRARRARKAAEKEAAAAAEGAQWRAANADLAGMLEAIYAEMAEAHDNTDPNAAYAAYDALEATWGDFILTKANLVGMGRPLNEKQTAALPDAIEKALVAQAAEKARQDASRWLGQVKDKVTVTGTVVVSTTFDRYNEYKYCDEVVALVIVEGTGEFAGVTLKLRGTGRTLYAAEQGATVVVTGTVKKHGEYEGIKQTEITRGKVTAK